MADSEDDIEFGDVTENPYRPKLPFNSSQSDLRQFGSSSQAGGLAPDPVHRDNLSTASHLPTRLNQHPVDPPPKSTASGILISLVCWGIFLVISTFIAARYHFHAPDAGEVSPRTELFQAIFSAKLMVGMKTMPQNGSENPKPINAFAATGVRSVRNMQANSVLTAEMNSLADASELLDELEIQAKNENYDFSNDEARVTDILRRIYRGLDPASVSQSERTHLTNELLWFGELALNLHRIKNEPVSVERRELLASARSKLITFVIALVMGILAFVGGLVGLTTFIVLYFTRKLHVRTQHYTQDSTVYIEAATGWLITYLLSGVAIGMFMPFSDPLLMNIAVAALSFAFAIAWPIIRGVRADIFMQDIGFVGNLFVESLMGLVSYIACLPILAAGYLMTIFAISVTGPTRQDETLSSPSSPGHPMVEWISEGNGFTIVLVFVVACVCAPILEETVFRGLMYRNLRDNTFRAGHFVSVTLSALINGIIFAAIHPQGLFFIPMLAALAFSFSIVREWRGSLIAPMSMHAIHNALVTSFLLFVVMD